MSFDAGPPVQKKSKLPLILGILGGGFILCAVCCGGIGYFAYDQFSAPVNAAVAEMENSPKLVEKLGTPIKADMSKIAIGNIKTINGNGKASGGFNVKGPKGTAKVKADMKQTAGTWTVNTLTAEFTDGSTITIPPGSGEAEPLEAPPADAEADEPAEQPAD